MRVIVTGSRDWIDRQRIREVLNDFLSIEIGPHVVVHGDCETGADYLAAEWAMLDHPMFEVSSEAHPAKWGEYGDAAGIIRNREMAGAGAEMCIAFWDGKSSGTRSMIEHATVAKIPVVIVPKGS